MKKIFEESYQGYKDYMSNIIPNFWEHFNCGTRRKQCESVINAINDRFNFKSLITVETGASHNPNDGIFGYFLGLATAKSGGKMLTVDINEGFLNENKNLFNHILPELNCRFHKGDSVDFLKNLQGDNIPNFVHLDSWDLDLKNPLPSALHGWNEFVAIESKMPSGSFIVIDDNYMNGSWVEWLIPNRDPEIIDITYPILGKGAHIYQYVLSGKSNWDLIGRYENVVGNLKIIIQKK